MYDIISEITFMFKILTFCRKFVHTYLLILGSEQIVWYTEPQMLQLVSVLLYANAATLTYIIRHTPHIAV